MSFPDPNQPVTNSGRNPIPPANPSHPEVPFAQPQSGNQSQGFHPPQAPQPQFGQPQYGQPLHAKPQYGSMYPQANAAKDNTVRNVLLILGGVGLILFIVVGAGVGILVYRVNQAQNEFMADLAAYEESWGDEEPDPFALALQDTLKNETKITQKVGNIESVAYSYDRSTDQNLGFVTKNWYQVTGDQGSVLVQTTHQSNSSKWFDKLHLDLGSGNLEEILPTQLPYFRDDDYVFQSRSLFHGIAGNQIIENRIGKVESVRGNLVRTENETSFDLPVYWMYVKGEKGTLEIRATYSGWGDQLAAVEVEQGDGSIEPLQFSRTN